MVEITGHLFLLFPVSFPSTRASASSRSLAIHSVPMGQLWWQGRMVSTSPAALGASPSFRCINRCPGVPQTGRWGLLAVQSPRGSAAGGRGLRKPRCRACGRDLHHFQGILPAGEHIPFLQGWRVTPPAPGPSQRDGASTRQNPPGRRCGQSPRGSSPPGQACL